MQPVASSPCALPAHGVERYRAHLNGSPWEPLQAPLGTDDAGRHLGRQTRWFVREHSHAALTIQQPGRVTPSVGNDSLEVHGVSPDRHSSL